MDAHAKKLIPQLDDDYPGVRVQAVDALHAHHKQTGATCRGYVAEIEQAETAVQELSSLRTDLAKAQQDNAAWVQRDAENTKEIAALKRQLALRQAFEHLRWSWKYVVAGVALLGICSAGAYRVTQPAWPEFADSGLRVMAQRTAWDPAAFDKPFISPINGHPFWVLVRGEIDSMTFADSLGHPISMRCVHLFSVPAEPADGAYLTPHPYALFGAGWLSWPERAKQCVPAPRAPEAQRDPRQQAGRS
jgi:hypothetical protein